MTLTRDDRAGVLSPLRGWALPLLPLPASCCPNRLACQDQGLADGDPCHSRAWRKRLSPPLLPPKGAAAHSKQSALCRGASQWLSAC